MGHRTMLKEETNDCDGRLSAGNTTDRIVIVNLGFATVRGAASTAGPLFVYANRAVDIAIRSIYMRTRERVNAFLNSFS